MSAAVSRGRSGSSEGASLWSEELRFGESHFEGIDNAPLVLDLDGDQLLDVFVVTGKGTSDESRPQNYGRAVALRAGAGKAKAGADWTTFRGGPTRSGQAGDR